jgi:7,8-dihydropterin-6-yl-methyl-4-(beta-D-ribofuranosyl)aminobenzene 5'-phosphate synthase
MKKDWGFSALVEVAGKRILFDTGNDPDMLAANVKAKGINLTNIGKGLGQNPSLDLP